MSPIKLLFPLLFLLASLCLSAQSSNLPIGRDSYQQIDRLLTQGFGDQQALHSSQKPYYRQDIFDSFYDTLPSITHRNSFILDYVMKDNNDYYKANPSKAFLKYFYKNRKDFWQHSDEALLLMANPVINFQLMANSDGDFRYINTRGLELRGALYQKLGFYFQLTDNQSIFPRYVEDRVIDELAVPFRGRFETYVSSSLNKVVYDYLNANAYISFQPLKNMNMQFGHGKHFLGNGYRSLLLSDFANNYLFWRINTKVWKFNYQNLFKELIVQFDNKADTLLDRKYAATHHLSLNVAKWLNIGVFESIVFARENGYDINYLNPVIFYRSVEHQLGSPDNVLIGADWRANLGKHLSFYGQFILDEFSFSRLMNEPNWWANKWAYQLGLKYFDIAGIAHLDGQVEYNKARPYIYSHNNIQNNYSHYNQPLAHPLGANFQEALAIIRYAPSYKWQIQLLASWMEKGEDIDTFNYGGNILVSNEFRVTDNDASFLQGQKRSSLYAGIQISYHWRHNILFDLYFNSRNSEVNGQSEISNLFGVGMRMNAESINWVF